MSFSHMTDGYMYVSDIELRVINWSHITIHKLMIKIKIILSTKIEIIYYNKGLNVLKN